jgi:RNA polymerase sigma factor (sigma-70 family)
MPRKKHKLGAGNIKAEKAYDPFPKSGLVKDYEPFIRKHVGEFCKRYPQLKRDDVLIEAVLIAIKAEPRFKPELGYDFSTFLRHELKRLNRFAEQEQKLQRLNVDILDGGFQKEQEAKEAEEAKTPEGMFYPGPNGPRFILDFQWMENGKRKRAVARLRVANEQVIGRASPDARILAGMKADLADRQAYIRAAFDHQERRQAEINQEGENQKRGDYNPVLLEARSITGGIDIRERKGREPPRLLPDHLPMASLSDAYSHDDEWVGSLADTIAQGSTPDSPELAVIEAIRAERPFLTPLQATIADWMLGLFSGTEERSQGQLADDLGKSEGYVSKQRNQVEEKVKKRLTK